MKSDEVQKKLDATWLEWDKPKADKAALWDEIVELQEQLAEAKRKEQE